MNTISIYITPQFTNAYNVFDKIPVGAKKPHGFENYLRFNKPQKIG